MKKILLFLIVLIFNSQLFAQHKNANLLIEDINFVDVVAGKIFPHTNILIKDGKIASIGKSGKALKTHPDIKTVDGRGQWLMPGLIDAQVELNYSGSLYSRPELYNFESIKSYKKEEQALNENIENRLHRYLLCGITTVGNANKNASFSHYKGNYKTPNIYKAGEIIINKEYESSKIKEAHKAGLKMIAYTPSAQAAKLAVEAGADILVYSSNDLIDKELLALMKKNKTVFIPLIMADINRQKMLNQTRKLTIFEIKKGNPFVTASFTDIATNSKHSEVKKYKVENQNLERQKKVALANLKLISDAAIAVVAASGAGKMGIAHGVALLTELQAMKAAGLTNMQVLQGATINAAKMLGKENEIGSIAIGQKADLIILDKNPIKDLSAFADIQLVIKDGHLIKTKYLLKDTPEILAQKQLNAYNSQNIEAFLAQFSNDVEIFNFPNKSQAKGKKEMRKIYQNLFKNTPSLHCKLENRIIQGNTVIDKELVTGIANKKPIKVTAIYTIKNNKISKVYFIR